MKTHGINPVHQACKVPVEVPTISVQKGSDGGRDIVTVQWFGEAEEAYLPEAQFRFHLSTPPDDKHWMGHPELFKVIMLGMAKNWPRPEAARAIAEGISRGDMEAHILWVASSHYRTDAGVACFVLPMNILLADPNVGIITPRHYCDVGVLERLNQESAA